MGLENRVRLATTVPRLEGEGEDARRDDQHAGHRHRRQVLAEDHAAGHGDQKGRRAAHQRIDEADVAGAVGGGHELEIGELQECRRQDERPGRRLRHRHQRKEGKADHPAAERDHRGVERLVGAGFDEGIPGRMQGRAEQHEKENV